MDCLEFFFLIVDHLYGDPMPYEVEAYGKEGTATQ